MRVVRRAIGPIMTTGVALVLAGVVVANPIVAPRSDVQIPAVQLAGTDSSGTGMLDAGFLNAIAPAPPESTNPLSVLKQLITSLAAGVSYYGKSALVDAFVAGVAAVSQPELTAASSPYVGAPPSLTDPSGRATSPTPEAGVTASVIALSDTLANSTAINNSLLPAAQQALASFATDADVVSTELVAAAYATGALVASEPELIASTLRALVAGDFQAALSRAVKAVAAPLGPPVMILDALGAVMHGHLLELLAPVAVLPSVVAPVDLLPADAASAEAVSTPAVERQSRRGQSGGGTPAPAREVRVPGPAAAAFAENSLANSVAAQRGSRHPASRTVAVNGPGVGTGAGRRASRSGVRSAADGR